MATSRGVVLHSRRANYSQSHQSGSQESPIDLTNPHLQGQQCYQNVQPQYLPAAHSVVSDPTMTYISHHQHKGVHVAGNYLTEHNGHNGLYVTSSSLPEMVHTRFPPQPPQDIQFFTSDMRLMYSDHQQLFGAYPTDCPPLEATYTSVPQPQTPTHAGHDPCFTVQLEHLASSAPASQHFPYPQMLQDSGLPLANSHAHHSTTPTYQTAAAVMFKSHYKKGLPECNDSKALHAKLDSGERWLTKTKPAEPSVPRKRKLINGLSHSSLPCIGPSQQALQPDCEEPLGQDNSPSREPATKPHREHYAMFIASEWESSDVAFSSDSFLGSDLHGGRADSDSSIHLRAPVHSDISLSHADDLVARESSDFRAICPQKTGPKDSGGKSDLNFSSLEDSHEPLNDRPLRPEQERLITSMMKFADDESVGPAPHYMYEHIRLLVQESDEITERQVASWDEERNARARIVDNLEEG
ncbi:hypothetical protein BKA63DRAFT_569286 [Paraphoma chrysanthemicola]|nr:hypothetical protein BKA63DRAFT_569286 [Paraphoma chrysanthemicola]